MEVLLYEGMKTGIIFLLFTVNFNLNIARTLIISSHKKLLYTRHIKIHFISKKSVTNDLQISGTANATFSTKRKYTHITLRDRYYIDKYPAFFKI